MTGTAQGAALHACIRACLTALPDDSAAAASALGALGRDAWLPFLGYAASHGVLAVLAPAMMRCPLPSDATEDLHRRLLVQEVWTTQVRTELHGHLQRFAAARIAVCALKGPSLAARVYADPQTRPSIDVDLLVSPSDLARARAALLQDGYVGDPEQAEQYLMAHSHHLHFQREGGVGLELHFHAYRGFGTIVDAAALIAHATESRFDGAPVLTPSSEDELIYLAAHAAGHSYVRLLWLFDLKLLVRNAAVDWQIVAERSEALGLRRVVGYTLRLLEGWLDVRGLPESMMRVAPIRTWLADRLLPRVAAPSEPTAADNLGGLVFTSVLCDSAAASWSLFSHHTSRALKRRTFRMAPGLVPASWSA